MSQEDLDLGMLDKMINYYLQKNKSKLEHTHRQCVLHIIRLRLIIFHTPKNFLGRNIIE